MIDRPALIARCEQWLADNQSDIEHSIEDRADIGALIRDLRDALRQLRPAPEERTTKKYTVEVDHGGCDTCSHGKTWTVVQPDGVALGQSFESQEDAEDLAELLNDAIESAEAQLTEVRTQLEQRRNVACSCAVPDPVMQADGRFCCHQCSFQTGARPQVLEPEDTWRAKQQLEADLVDLRTRCAQLKEFVRHKNGCQFSEHPERWQEETCTCGLRAALEGIRRAPPPPVRQDRRRRSVAQGQHGCIHRFQSSASTNGREVTAAKRTE